MRLFIDTETRGPSPGALDQLGLYNYARHPGSRLLLVSYAIDDGPEVVWDAYHDPKPPAELRRAAQLADEVVAHNAMFDRLIDKYKAGLVPPQRVWHCTASRARVHGLPGDLETLSKIYRLGDDSKKNGAELIQLFCEKGADPDAHPLEWLEFIDYSRADITSLRRLYSLLPAWEWSERKRAMYALDQQINDRGFAVDLDLAQRMIDASELCQKSLNARVERLTDGAVQKGTQRAAVKSWIGSDGLIHGAGFELIDMKAETLRKALRENKAGRIALTDNQIEMIELRLLSSKSSTAKCRTALKLAGPDSRIRGAITFNGGGRIGRFSHKGFQPGNLPRPEYDKEIVASAIEILKEAGPDALISFWGDEATAVCASALRGLIVAATGHKLLEADYSNIEGRYLAWLAGEDWKLQAYRDKDAGTGEDFYRLLGSQMTGRPISMIDDYIRQQFKGVELSSGYEGAVGAYLNIANSYKLDLVDLARGAPGVLAPEFMRRGADSWEYAQKHGDTYDLPREIYVACSAYVHAWRDACPATTQLWVDLLSCAKEAVKAPGRTFTCADGKIAMKATADWLAMQIPSGRKIMFAKPKIETRVTKTENGEKIRTQLTALKAPGWYREGIYGGLIANAATQGGCADILQDAMLELDADGYPIVMHVHDNVLAELPDSDPRTHKDMIGVMLRQASKYRGLPLNADGFTAKRNRKG